MIEDIWDNQTKCLLAYVENRQDVFRAADHKRIGTYRNGAVYDLSDNLVCHLGLLNQSINSEPLPEAFKELLHD